MMPDHKPPIDNSLPISLSASMLTACENSCVRDGPIPYFCRYADIDLCRYADIADTDTVGKSSFSTFGISAPFFIVDTDTADTEKCADISDTDTGIGPSLVQTTVTEVNF